MAPSASWSIAEATRNWFDQHQLIKTEKEEEEDDDHHEPQLPKSSPNAELYGEIAKKRGKNETFSKWKIKLQNPVIPESSVLISVIILVGHFKRKRTTTTTATTTKKKQKKNVLNSPPFQMSSARRPRWEKKLMEKSQRGIFFNRKKGIKNKKEEQRCRVSPVDRRRWPPRLSANETTRIRLRSVLLKSFPFPWRPQFSSTFFETFRVLDAEWSCSDFGVTFAVLYGLYLGFLEYFSGFTEFYRVSPGFTGFYRVLPDFTGFYWVLLGFTGFYRVLPGFLGPIAERLRAVSRLSQSNGSDCIQFSWTFFFNYTTFYQLLFDNLSFFGFLCYFHDWHIVTGFGFHFHFQSFGFGRTLTKLANFSSFGFSGYPNFVSLLTIDKISSLIPSFTSIPL